MVDENDLTQLALDVLLARDRNAPSEKVAAALDALLRAIIVRKSLGPAIRRFLFNEDDVETAEQRALVAISFNLGSWSREGSVEPWFRQIAANEAKMMIRSRERRRHYEGAAGNATSEFVERLSSHLATKADLDRAMERLAPELTAPLALRRQGFSYQEVATLLGIAEGTAKSRVRAGRAALAELLARRTER